MLAAPTNSRDVVPCCLALGASGQSLFPYHRHLHAWLSSLCLVVRHVRVPIAACPVVSVVHRSPVAKGVERPRLDHFELHIYWGSYAGKGCNKPPGNVAQAEEIFEVRCVIPWFQVANYLSTAFRQFQFACLYYIYNIVNHFNKESTLLVFDVKPILCNSFKKVQKCGICLSALRKMWKYRWVH